MFETHEVCAKGPELLTPTTPRVSASPDHTVEGRRSETLGSSPRSRKRKVSCSSLDLLRCYHTSSNFMYKRRRSALIDRWNHENGAESASVQKLNPEKAFEALRLLKEKFPEFSFALDTATGQIRIQRLEQADDGDNASSSSLPASSEGLVSKARSMIPDATFSVFGTRWSDDEDSILGDAYERGMEAKQIQKTFLPQRSRNCIKKRLQILTARDRSLHRRRDSFMGKDLTRSASGALWSDAEDEALISAYERGLNRSQIHAEVLPQRTLSAVCNRLYLLRAISRNPPEANLVIQEKCTSDLRQAARFWTAAEERMLIHARFSGWSVGTIQQQLFPGRTYDAFRSHS